MEANPTLAGAPTDVTRHHYFIGVPPCQAKQRFDHISCKILKLCGSCSLSSHNLHFFFVAPFSPRLKQFALR
jgi:hypothetical protein